MKVWVIMSNDYPDCVFSSEKAAEAFVKSKMEDKATRLPGGIPRIYWRAYEFEVRTDA